MRSRDMIALISIDIHLFPSILIDFSQILVEFDELILGRWTDGSVDKPTDGTTDRPTVRRTNTASYRDARTHLKKNIPNFRRSICIEKR
jgi:hypothetical protein